MCLPIRVVWVFTYWLLIGDGWFYLTKILKGFHLFPKHFFFTTFPKLEIVLHIEKLNVNLACCPPGKPSLVTLLPEMGSPKWNPKNSKLEICFAHRKVKFLPCLLSALCTSASSSVYPPEKPRSLVTLLPEKGQS
jgi:hypothetical protein